MPKFHELTIDDVRQETEDCVSIQFQVPADLTEKYSFRQGQYLTLRADIDGEDTRRSYSICSGVGEPLRVAIKQVPYGKFSTYANDQVEAGQSMQVMTPMGRFYTKLDSGNQKNYVGFAAGSGITPLLSIIKTTLAEEPKSSFTLFYGNKKTTSIIFKEEIEDLKNEYMGRLRVFYVLSREAIDIPMFAGRLDGDKCATYAQTLFDIEDVDEYFLCGPESMIKGVTGYLEENGVDKKKLHFELFTSPTQKLNEVVKPETFASADANEKKSDVTIVLDGMETNLELGYAGENILDAGRNLGVDLPYACKGGVCCTCRAKLVEGDVEMMVNYALEPEEVEAGFVLTCQCHPRSEKVVIDFDQQ